MWKDGEIIYPDVKKTHAYRSVFQHYDYGKECAKRSGVPKINHIDEGLIILDELGSDFDTKQAWCIHPLMQMDDDLIKYLEGGDSFHMSPRVTVLAMEYRNKANAYLCRPETDDILFCNLPKLPLNQVRDMLIADKVQNKKDFMKYHYGTHPRSAQLLHYFSMWLSKLNVSYDYYRHLCDLIDSNKS